MEERAVPAHLLLSGSRRRVLAEVKRAVQKLALPPIPSTEDGEKVGVLERFHASIGHDALHGTTAPPLSHPVDASDGAHVGAVLGKHTHATVHLFGPWASSAGFDRCHKGHVGVTIR